jgi:Cu/Ag efflux protein CusF
MLSLAIAAGPALAQAQRPATPPAGSTYPSAPAERPSAAEKTSTGMLEGSITKVDPGANKVQVSSGLFGMFGKTLEVTSNTQIQVEGRQATLADIREGAKVKASYEARDSRNVATRIEVMPAQEKERLPAQNTERRAPQPKSQ